MFKSDAKFEHETFEEWRNRQRLPRVRAAAKLAAQKAAFEAAPLIPAVRFAPQRGCTEALVRELKSNGGILYTIYGSGRFAPVIAYFADPVKYAEAKRTVSGRIADRYQRRTSAARQQRFAKALLSEFPGMPKEVADAIAEETFSGLGGVGTSDLPLRQRTWLAARAWLRHHDLLYEGFLRSADGDRHGDPEYEGLRRLANSSAEDILSTWKNNKEDN